MSSTALAAAAMTVALAGFTTWVGAADKPGVPPPGAYAPQRDPSLTLTGPAAEAGRVALVRRAVVRPDGTAPPPVPAADLLECRFLSRAPTGTSAKFDCVLPGGDVIKVKYGRNPEIHAEAAATRLLHRLGFAADRVDIVPRLRCYGCPRFPFLTMQLLTLTSTAWLLEPHGHDHGYTEFTWVGVERKFPAPAIETEATEGWAWFELARASAPRADLDALRLAAIFLAHWDNKSANQRLVCLDSPPPLDPEHCRTPLLMVQDLGATFGPSKVNLARWRSQRVWADPATCTVSMRTLPWKGATFADVRISEAGRARLARDLAAMSDDDIRGLFAAARFPEYQIGTRDDRDLDAWTAAFTERRAEITGVRCPEAAADPQRLTAR